MRETEHVSVCNRTEGKDERVRIRNSRTGQEGFTFSCTASGETIQVELDDGSLDSWSPEECEEV